MSESMRTLVLLFQCRDQKGIVAAISDVIYRYSGNILTADQYSTDPEGGYFFMRTEFSLERETGENLLTEGFSTLAERFAAQWRLYDKSKKLKMGVLAGATEHCLREILYMHETGELRAHIPFVISNSEKHRRLVTQYNIPYLFIPSEKNNRREEEIIRQLKDKTDFLVLARYMLMFSPGFLLQYGKDIINIHHGFLPSFKGADPYKNALEEGVKVIGSTAHFVNEQLDEGPIITQCVEQVSHKDSIDILIKKGRDLEKKALISAISSYLDYRIIRHGAKTIVF